MKKLKVKKEKGITLVALVVTIVVLLILAGISLNLVLGQNGIVSKAKEAREKTDEATTNTELFFNSTVDEIDKIIGDNNTSSEKITDEEFKKNPTNYKHKDQSDENKDTGIGTDGRPVNMDLWYYEIIWDGSLRLGAIDGSYIGGPGYENSNITSEGTIKGTVPRLIYVAEKDEVLAVTSMYGTFYNCTNLRVAPELPDTITDMHQTFEGCTGLIKASEIPTSVTRLRRIFYGCGSLKLAPSIPKNVTNIREAFEGTGITTAPTIPENVQDMAGAFSDCVNLTTAPKIPKNVTSLNQTFSGCMSLTVAPAIPDGVINLYGTFDGCTNLTTASAIPESVNEMEFTFQNCTSLTGTITINATLNYKDGCFKGTVKPIVLKGTSPNLAELAATAENGNVTVEQ